MGDVRRHLEVKSLQEAHAFSCVFRSSLERRGKFRHIASRPLFAASCKACGRDCWSEGTRCSLLLGRAAPTTNEVLDHERGACAVQQRAGMPAAEFADMVLRGL